MEIRRIEPDLIPPTVASERGAQINPDHHERDGQQPKRERHTASSKPEEQHPEHDDVIPGTVTYSPEGRIHEPEPPESGMHSLDFRA